MLSVGLNFNCGIISIGYPDNRLNTSLPVTQLRLKCKII